uniref:HYLS1 centriolar and ciliogenesis associated n=1 Tax=Cynoglossus semilaevis TaxID=244447 RepID=A0A3P8WXB4_CYNSE
MTSGYGTYRPDEQEAEDHRDDQDSRGDLSETRDEGDEDALSFSSFNWFDIELASAPEFHRTGEDGDEENPDCLRTYCVHDSPRDDEAEMSNIRPHNHKDQADDEKSGLHRDGSIGFESDVEHHRGSTGGTGCEKVDENMLDLRGDDRVEDRAEDRYDPEDSSGSGSNKDIRFLDSEVDSDWMTSSGVLEEKLRPKEAASSVEERLAELDLSAPAHRDSDAENDLSSETEGAMRSAFESYIRGMSHAEGDLRPKPKSFIRPVMTQQNMKKSDPVSRYFEYKQFWEMYKLPGEKDRRDLRWEIRDRLAYQPPPPKPRRVFEPNTYVVPTEKKRSALRWQIRNDLANGLLPHKYSYRF